jgi:phosphate transport system substrate-binding protein
VVALVAHTPLAIGYSGMGYATPEVKMLKVSRRKGEPGAEPIVRNARQRSYPLTRALQIYTVGELAPPVARYLAWMLEPEGQAVVDELGYVTARVYE